MEVLNRWILDMDIWFDYNMIHRDGKIPLAKLRLARLVNLLVVELVENQNPITSWTRLMEALSLTFYPSGYK
jgi:hypothetical protein